MAYQLAINPFTEEMLSSMQCMLKVVHVKLGDTFDLATEPEIENIKASSFRPWRGQLNDQIWELQSFHDELCNTDHYVENEVPGASMLFEAFKKACEQISSSIDAKVKEYYGEENLVVPQPGAAAAACDAHLGRAGNHSPPPSPQWDRLLMLMRVPSWT